MSVADDMKIPELWRCGDCVHIRRCKGLFGVKGDEPHCDFSPSRFRLDTIGVLCRIVESAGMQVTFYGEPVSADELLGIGRGIVEQKIRTAIEASRQRSDGQEGP